MNVPALQAATPTNTKALSFASTPGEAKAPAQVLTITPDEFQRLQQMTGPQIQTVERKGLFGTLKNWTFGAVKFLTQGTWNGLKNVARMFHPSQWKKTASNVAIGTAVITAGSTVFLWHFAPLAIPFNAFASLVVDMAFEFARGFFPKSQQHQQYLNQAQLLAHYQQQQARLGPQTAEASKK